MPVGGAGMGGPGSGARTQQLQHDLLSACCALENAKLSQDGRVLERVSEAKIGLKKMKVKLESAICTEKDWRHRCSDLEQQKEELN
eukprot:3659198-Ditylum_brightwellii.AAC.1